MVFVFRESATQSRLLQDADTSQPRLWKHGWLFNRAALFYAAFAAMPKSDQSRAAWDQAHG
ncbi:hypothetical protein ABFT80_03290 [Mesorhizobium sp. SB112]|uniref:hypothetical protein n=1 Tax=Mesorhizobium sp. SB112 TaxID=3151853 RepID=UPI0032647E41